MNDNELTKASSSNERSRRFKMTYERVVIECEENLGVFDRDHAMVPMTTAASGRAYRSTREARLDLWGDSC